VPPRRPDEWPRGREGRNSVSAQMTGRKGGPGRRPAEVAEGSWRKRRFLFYKCKFVSGFLFWRIQVRFPLLGRAFAICVKKTGGGKRMKRGRAPIDFVGRCWRRAHVFLFASKCSAACQVFWAVLGAKWLILPEIDACDRKRAGHHCQFHSLSRFHLLFFLPL
jgi:hypothetical protein